jgi:hypothetical protein
MNCTEHAAVCIGLLLFGLLFPVYAEEEGILYGGPPSPEEIALRQAGLSGIGLTFINGDPFFRIQLQPEVDLGKIGVGLDVVLLYNPDAEEDEDKIVAEDGEKWDNFSTILRLVRYIRYGHLNEPLYARFGELDYVTIGHGFIMSGYSNYDRRGLRLNVSHKTRKYGVETVINNLGDPTIFGGRVFIRPLQREGGTPIINRLEFGGAYLTDIDPNLIPDIEGDAATIDEDPLIALGVDVGLPIITTKFLSLTLYDDLAFLNTKRKRIENEAGVVEIETETATGNAVGAALTIINALFKVEYRTFGEGFIPTIFDYTYEAATAATAPDFLGLEMDDDKGESRRGYFALAAWRPIPKVDLLGTFEDYTNSDPKLYLGLTESGLVERLSLRAFYVKRNIGEPDPGYPDAEGSEDPGFFEDLFRLDDKSAFTVRIGYEIFPSLELAIIREYRFQQVEDAEGETRFTPIQKTSFEAGLKLNF